MLTNWIVLDIATAPIEGAATYIEGAVKAPSNYKDPDAIANYIREEEAKRVSMAATDIDLARVTGIAIFRPSAGATPYTSVGGTDFEMFALDQIVEVLQDKPTIITFGGSNFDLPVLMRRARYLGVDFPVINLDRYKSPHIDLCEVLSDRNPQRRRSLQFYAKRLGWTDMSKPLSGAEEAQVPVTGKWDELAASLRHDVTATYRLACWLGVIQPQPEMSADAQMVGF